MKKTRKSIPITIILAVLTFAFVLVSCDTDDCFSNDNYKSLKTEKAAPGTQPIVETDC